MLDHVFTDAIGALRDALEGARLERLALEERFQADVVLQCRAYRRKVSVPEFLEFKAGLGEGAQYDTHRGTDFLKVERFGYLTESLRAFQGYHGVCLCFDGLSCGSDHLLFTVAQNLDSKKNTVLPPVAAPTGNRVEAALFHTRTSLSLIHI